MLGSDVHVGQAALLIMAAGEALATRGSLYSLLQKGKLAKKIYITVFPLHYNRYEKPC